MSPSPLPGGPAPTDRVRADGAARRYPRDGIAITRNLHDAIVIAVAEQRLMHEAEKEPAEDDIVFEYDSGTEMIYEFADRRDQRTGPTPIFLPANDFDSAAPCAGTYHALDFGDQWRVGIAARAIDENK